MLFYYNNLARLVFVLTLCVIVALFGNLPQQAMAQASRATCNPQADRVRDFKNFAWASPIITTQFATPPTRTSCPTTGYPTGPWQSVSSENRLHFWFRLQGNDSFLATANPEEEYVAVRTYRRDANRSYHVEKFIVLSSGIKHSEIELELKFNGGARQLQTDRYFDWRGYFYRESLTPGFYVFVIEAGGYVANCRISAGDSCVCIDDSICGFSVEIE